MDWNNRPRGKRMTGPAYDNASAIDVATRVSPRDLRLRRPLPRQPMYRHLEPVAACHQTLSWSRRLLGMGSSAVENLDRR